MSSLSALPATILSASVNLTLNMAPSQKVLATISLLKDVHFNECEAPAYFSLLWLQVQRRDNISVHLSAMGDAIEDWPRYTIFREFTLNISNLTEEAISDLEVKLLLRGYPPAPTRKLSEYERKPALPVVADINGPVKATNKAGLSLPVQTRAV